LEVRCRNLLVKHERAILGFTYIFSRSLKVLNGQNSEQAHPKTKQGKKRKVSSRNRTCVLLDCGAGMISTKLNQIAFVCFPFRFV